MNTVVGKLLDVDRQARQLLDDARQYYEKTIEEIDKEKEGILRKYTEKAEKHVRDVQNQVTAEIEEATAKIRADSIEKNLVMEKTFESNHKTWEDELYKRCVKRVEAGA